MKKKGFYSPNFNKQKRSKKSIKIIIIHYTGMQSERESIIRLRNPQSKASSHFLINQNGKVYRLVQDNLIAWHAGKSCWRKYKNLNKNSIGIELVKILARHKKIYIKYLCGNSSVGKNISFYDKSLSKKMKIISFEGIEGVGKSTQIDLLHDYLLNAGKSVKKFREPGFTIPS